MYCTYINTVLILDEKPLALKWFNKHCILILTSHFIVSLYTFNSFARHFLCICLCPFKHFACSTKICLTSEVGTKQRTGDEYFRSRGELEEDRTAVGTSKSSTKSKDRTNDKETCFQLWSQCSLFWKKNRKSLMENVFFFLSK